MRKTRVLPIIFAVIVTVLLVFTKNASAAEYWSFEPVVIGDAIRVYDETSSTIKTYENRTYVKATNGSEYIINTPEVYLEVKGSTGCRLNTYVDGKHVEGSKILVSSGYSYGVIVRYLTPGDHTIEIKAFTGKPMDTTVKTVTVKVKISDYQDQYMKKSMEKINDGIATIDDYENVCIDYTRILGNGITVDQINSQVSGKNLRYEDVQSTVYNIINDIQTTKLNNQALSKIYSGTATVADYKKLGVEGVTASNLKKVNALVLSENSNKEVGLSNEEIQVLVDQLPQRIEIAQNRASNGEADTVDFKLLGIETVTDEILEDVNWYLKGKDNSTVSKINTNVTIVSLALRSVNSGTAKVSYYTTLDMKKVNSNNAKIIGEAIKEAKEKKGSSLTRKEIIEYIDNVVVKVDDSINRINNGQGTLSDYQLLGLTAVKAETVNDVNWYLKGKDNSTIAKMTTNISKINIMLKSINSGGRTISYYNTLGITNVNSKNSLAVSNAIKEARAQKGSDLTRIEIIQVVERTV